MHPNSLDLLIDIGMYWYVDAAYTIDVSVIVSIELDKNTF